MEETLIRGAVQGLTIAVIGSVIVGVGTLIWKLMRSPSEGARRIRWVLAGLSALLVGAILVDSGGITALLIGAAVIGVAVWIYRGFKKG